MFLDLQSSSVAFAWAGDSEALIVREGRVIFRTSRHDLENRHERFRIKSDEANYNYSFRDGYLCKRGGHGHCVMPTRGLGDLDMEGAGFIPFPETSEFIPLRTGDLVIIASDGLWDVVDADQVIELLMAGTPAGPTRMLDLGTRLAEKAVSSWLKEYGRASEADDISILIYEQSADRHLLGLEL
eukprot:gnl/TRDRNA2_/TRDRNA2_88443_c0_seq1.p1 gnl/TRDRNA2_/TRDRNA2_88443_c0~~gnl/TRDRNA2_/TRDRNA2_88443_c0_seq1.p1  ORF type:complete len:184 (+),score=18.19 gnl/TRDRNA2_/TRDRNA2_88443_c0_seq1:3-554(+)